MNKRYYFRHIPNTGLSSFYNQAIEQNARNERLLNELEVITQKNKQEIIEAIQSLPLSLETIVEFVKMHGKLPTNP